jgi:hypothetical protein
MLDEDAVGNRPTSSFSSLDADDPARGTERTQRERDP